MEGLSERTERMVDFVRMKCSEVESRKRKIDAEAWEVGYRRESLDKWEKELDERDRDLFLYEKRKKWELAEERTRFLAELRRREEDLDLRITAENERADRLEAEKSEVCKIRRRASERLKNTEAERESLRLERESLAEKEKKVDARISAVEKEEEQFNLLREGKLREINLEEEELDKKLEEFAEKVRVWVQKMLKHRFMAAEIKVKMDEWFEDNAGCESLALRLREADLIMESVGKKLEELEKMKTEFTSFQEEKNRDLASKEKLLKTLSEELIKDVQWRNEQLTEREVSGHRLLERLEMAKDDVEGMKRSCDERFQETCFKIRELASKELLLEMRSKEVFSEAELRNEELIEREKSLRQLLERLEMAKDDVEGMKRSCDERFQETCLKIKVLASKEQLHEVRSKEGFSEAKLRNEELIEREKSVRQLLERLEMAKDDVEGMKRSCDERFQETCLKIRELASKEQLLDVKSKEVFREAELRNEKWIEREKSGHKLLERLELAKATVVGLSRTVLEKHREIGLKETELDSLRDWVEKKTDETDLKERECNLKESELKEQQELGRRLLERLKLAKDDAEGMKRRCAERVQEISLKIRELASKEQLLEVRSEEVFRKAELKNEEWIEREKFGHQLLERLELAKGTVEGLSRTVLQKHGEIGLKETELDSLRDWVEKKMDETDLRASEVKEREQKIAEKEAHLISKETELQETEKNLWGRREQKIAEKEAHLISKETELQEMEKNLWAWQKELEDERKEVDLAQKSNVQKSEKLDFMERNLNSVREFTRNCFKEYRDKKRKLKTDQDLVEKRAIELDLKEQHLNNALKDIELREKQMEDSVKPFEQHQHSPKIFNTPLMIEPDDSADLKFMVKMDGKTLQIFLNDAEKDMESMGDEIFKVLHLSSDPAKLVLDAMEGFYPPHLRKEDVEFNVRRTCITLLEQLTKMSPEIKPNVREEAIGVASSWKSKLGDSVETARPIEALGFLFLLTAYDLFSYFDCDEVASLLMMVDQHKETAEFLYVLGSEMEQ